MRLLAEGNNWRLWELVDNQGVARYFDVYNNGKWYTVSYKEI